MKRNRKRHLANDAERARKYRRRKQDRLRRKQDDCFRATLETFYRDNEIAPAAWILLSEFTESLLWLPHRLYFQQTGVEPAPVSRLTTVETAALSIGGDSVLLIRPKYFLSEEK